MAGMYIKDANVIAQIALDDKIPVSHFDSISNLAVTPRQIRALSNPIFSTVQELVNYATSSSLAFPGQVCTVLTVNSSTLYQIDFDGSIKIVGGMAEAVTEPPGTSNTRVATTEFVQLATKYTHSQLMPAAVWTITHNMHKYPNFIIIDSTGEEVRGDHSYVNLNTITLTFSAEISGIAYLT